MKFKNKCAIAGCASTAFLFGSMASADVISVTGSYTGANGPDNTSMNYGGYYGGSPGNTGYTASSSSSTYIINATIKGGNGGTYSGANGPGPGGPGAPGLAVSGSPLATINGGTYTGGSAGSYGGEYAPGLTSFSPLVINGGTFTGGAPFPGDTSGGDGADTYGGAVAIYGGSFNGLGSGEALNGQNPISIYGGTFHNTSTVFAALTDSTYNVNIYGTNFTVNNVAVGYGPLTLTSGTLSGLLEDNSTTTSITYSVSNGSKVNLLAPVPVPEPTSAGLIIGGAGIALGRRRRKA